MECSTMVSICIGSLIAMVAQKCMLTIRHGYSEIETDINTSIYKYSNVLVAEVTEMSWLSE